MPIAVSPFNGSHFTMLKMMEGFIKRDEIKIANARHARVERMEAVMSGKVKAASLHGALDQRRREAKGARVIMESHSTRSEAAGDETGRSDPRQDVPRRGARRRGHPEEPGKAMRIISSRRPAA